MATVNSPLLLIIYYDVTTMTMSYRVMVTVTPPLLLIIYYDVTTMTHSS